LASEALNWIARSLRSDRFINEQKGTALDIFDAIGKRIVNDGGTDGVTVDRLSGNPY